MHVHCIALKALKRTLKNRNAERWLNAEEMINFHRRVLAKWSSISTLGSSTLLFGGYEFSKFSWQGAGFLCHQGWKDLQKGRSHLISIAMMDSVCLCLPLIYSMVSRYKAYYISCPFWLLSVYQNQNWVIKIWK